MATRHEYATKGIKSLGKISAICLIKLLNWGAQLPTPGISRIP
jgi:hypothetical protein